MIPENATSQEETRARFRKLVGGVSERAAQGCSRKFCFREYCRSNPGSLA